MALPRESHSREIRSKNKSVYETPRQEYSGVACSSAPGSQLNPCEERKSSSNCNSFEKPSLITECPEADAVSRPTGSVAARPRKRERILAHGTLSVLSLAAVLLSSGERQWVIREGF